MHAFCLTFPYALLLAIGGDYMSTVLGAMVLCLIDGTALKRCMFIPCDVPPRC